MKIIFLLVTITYAYGATTCTPDGETVTEQPDKCLHPAVFKDTDYKWVAETNQKGWFSELGNKVSRLHMAEILKGELLPEDSDFTNMCQKLKFQTVVKGYNNGTTSGFGGKTGHWECKGIEEEPGAFNCQFYSDLTKYEDSLKFFLTFSDNKEFYVVVACFPNGENGWFTHGASYPLSAENREVLAKHIKELGFSDEIVNLYGPECA